MPKYCGAKRRDGGRCRVSPMKNGRCRIHGGTSTGPYRYNAGRNALKHCLYSRFITPQERTALSHVRLGILDDEIRLMRVRLNRALAAEDAAQGKPELEETVEREGASEYAAKSEKKSKVRDYGMWVDRIISRITQMELARKELMKEGAGDEDARLPVSRIVVEVVGANNSHDHERPAG